jgi:RimJ/RimL family protein N-acetyltransferase
VIVTPKTGEELQAAQMFMLFHAGVQPSADARYIGWVEDDQLKMLVAFTAFVGKTCQMHVAMNKGFHFTPRKMLDACFDYAFNHAGRDMVLGIVNSRNERAMRYDMHLGFKLLYALPGMHDDGGDVVLMGMKREECPYLKTDTPAEAVH